MSNSTVSDKQAWGDPDHAKVFDYMHSMPNFILKKHYESFNEGRLLMEVQLKSGVLYEVGCATGELYRYLRNNQRHLSYHGFDLSEPAIRRAREKYPEARFTKLNGGTEEIRKKFEQPDLVWCRDVIMHQNDPYLFLKGLVELAKEAVIMRFRTRDKGATIFRTEDSCQLHWDRFWVPYIVLNTDEMLHAISAHSDVCEVVVCRACEVLGGHNSRILPKDLYFKSSGTAETALLIRKGIRKGNSMRIIYQDSKNSDRPQYNYFERMVQKLFTV